MPPEASRDLRDRWSVRIAILALVLVAALLFSNGCGSKGRNLSSDEAVAAARKEVSFEPDRHQVRFLQQGIPPHPFWGVSFYNVGKSGQPTRIELFLVDATTGDVKRAN